MRRCLHVGLAAGAVLVWLSLTGAASANRAMRIEPSGEITKANEGETIITEAEGLTLRCARFILRGRILVTDVPKSSAGRLPEGRIGQLEGATINECRGFFGGAARVTLLASPERPIAMRYNSFSGTLPNITAILITKLEFRILIEEMGISCLYVGTVGLQIEFPPVETREGVRFNSERFLRATLTRERGVPCPRSVGAPAGNFHVTTPQILLLN